MYLIAEEEEIMFTAVLRCAMAEGGGDILKEEETEILCCHIWSSERIHK